MAAILLCPQYVESSEEVSQDNKSRQNNEDGFWKKKQKPCEVYTASRMLNIFCCGHGLWKSVLLISEQKIRKDIYRFGV